METQEKKKRVPKDILCDYCNMLYSVRYRRCPFCGGGENREEMEKDLSLVKREQVEEQKIESIPPAIPVAPVDVAEETASPVEELRETAIEEVEAAPEAVSEAVQDAMPEEVQEEMTAQNPEDVLAQLDTVLKEDKAARDRELAAILAEFKAERDFDFKEALEMMSPDEPKVSAEEKKAKVSKLRLVPVAKVEEAPAEKGMEELPKEEIILKEEVQPAAEEVPEKALEATAPADVFPENPVDLRVFDAIAAQGKVHFDENGQEMYPEEKKPKGGKRARGGSSEFSPLRAIRLVISLLLIAAAIFILATKVYPVVEDKLPSLGWGSSQNEKEDENAPAVGGGDTEEEEPPVLEEVFRLKDTNLTLTSAGETVTLEIIYQGKEDLGALTWESSDDSVVVVNSDGAVKAIAEGDATISVTRGKETLTCSLHCVWSQTGEDLDLSLNRDDFTLKAEESFTMEVIGTDSEVKWSIEDESVATVSDKGVVTHVGSGATTLTATVAGQELTCTVRCR